MSTVSAPPNRLSVAITRSTGWFGVGSWRLLLAGLVALSHLWSRMIEGPAAYAVWGFYVLSGYLMTYVLISKYGFSLRGLKDYAFNRFIRIYPAYWIALALGVVVYLVVVRRGIDPTLLNPSYYLPSGTFWLNPLTLFPLFPTAGLPVAVSNALAIEIGAYLLIPLFASSRAASWVALIVSGLVALKLGLIPETFAERYASLVPCFLPFAAGSLVCHYRAALLRLVAPRTSVLVWLAHGTIWWWHDPWPWTYGLYVSVVLSAWVTLSLTAQRSSRSDRLFGDLSYPVYLLHTIAGAALLGIWGYERPFRFAALALLITLVASYLMMIGVERPLYRLKKKGTRSPASVTDAGPAPVVLQPVDTTTWTEHPADPEPVTIPGAATPEDDRAR